MVVLMLTAAISTMHPPKCAPGAVCAGPTSWQLAFLLSGFAFLVIGAGGIRPCNLAFGADQFNPNTESGKRGITSFLNWYYFTFTFAVMISVTGIVYVQSNVSWAIGLGIPAFLMLLSCVMFFVGTRIYVIVKPQGSPITSIVQVLVAATKKRGLKVPDNSAMSLFNYIPAKSINSKLPSTEQFRLEGSISEHHLILTIILYNNMIDMFSFIITPAGVLTKLQSLQMKIRLTWMVQLPTHGNFVASNKLRR
jgi:peptide/histidine transporter 3/4